MARVHVHRVGARHRRRVRDLHPALRAVRGVRRRRRRQGRQTPAHDRGGRRCAPSSSSRCRWWPRARCPAVYVLAFLIATAGVFFDPAKLSILPEIVPPGRLLRANSLMSTAENLTEILGWAFAGLLLAAVSTSAAFRARRADVRRLRGGAGRHALPGARARRGGADGARVLGGAPRRTQLPAPRPRCARQHGDDRRLRGRARRRLPAHVPVRRARARRRDARVRPARGGGGRRLPRRLARARGPRPARAQGTRDDRRPRRDGPVPGAGRGHRTPCGPRRCRWRCSASPTRLC